MTGAENTPLVAVIATGGTIASKRGADGGATPALTGEDLLALLPDARARLRPVELMARDSSSLTLCDMQRISDAVKQQLDDPAIAGIVVLHGTDTMEETALLVQLQHVIGKPVVFTGAQRTSDHPDADGPSNLTEAINAATDPQAANLGVLVAFGRRTLPAWGFYKHSSDDPDAFRSSRTAEPVPSPGICARVDDIRVDIVAIYPGCDATHIEASLQAGARGIVLCALGSGNANVAIAQAVKACTAKAIPVVVSSRVPQGALVPAYGGGGGGHDLAAAGAIHSTSLRPGQARILLCTLIAANSSSDAIAEAFKR